MKIGVAEAAELFPSIGTAFAGAKHDGMAVGLLAEIQVDMAGVDLSGRVRAVVGVEDQITGGAHRQLEFRGFPLVPGVAVEEDGEQLKF